MGKREGLSLSTPFLSPEMASSEWTELISTNLHGSKWFVRWRNCIQLIR